MRKIALLFILCIALAFGACTQEKAQYPLETKSILVTAEGETVAEVTLDEIQQMKSVVRRMVVHTSSGDETYDFKGTELLNILNAADETLAERFRYVYISGADDYISELTMDEVLAENNVYIMYADGEALLPMRNGEPGGMRVVVLKDFYGQRFTNYVTSVELTKEPKA